MQSLALFVAILMLMALLGGPIAIGLSAIKTDQPILNIIRKIFHGFFVTISLWIGMMFFFNPDVPLVAHLIGLYGLVMGYIASRREYFPDVRVVTPLLARFGIDSKVIRQPSGDDDFKTWDPDSSDTPQLKKSDPLRHGPAIKWRRNGRTGGNDGHGPGGQH